MRHLIIAAVAFAAATSANALTVVNGDFEAGNTGFTSSYTFVPVGAEAQMGEAKYSVAHTALATHTSFADFSDHTLGTPAGNYMVVNGSSVANTVVWQSSPIAVSSGTYNFSAFLSSVYFQSPALLQFTATPDVGPAISLGNFSAPGTTGVWQGVGSNFVIAPGTTSITLSIINQNTDLQGNDFGIDDISLSVVPEPATWGLMLAGFAGVGIATRRRRTTTVAA